MAKDHGPSIKDDKQYEGLRKRGYSKETAARIANTDNAGEKGGHAKPYEERTKEDLYELAKERDIQGRSNMSKDELIQALRRDR